MEIPAGNSSALRIPRSVPTIQFDNQALAVDE
jgi:hypothetical protein